ADRLTGQGIDPQKLRPGLDQFKIVEGKGLAARHVMFGGVGPLSSFRYRQVHEFAANVVRQIARKLPQAVSLGMTIHGTGYGLDADESLGSQLAGYVEALTAGPSRLERISVVDHNAARV